MAITVGLDFGTHQTKICIENSDIPLHKTYEFMNGKRVFTPCLQSFRSIKTILYDMAVLIWTPALLLVKRRLLQIRVN